MSRPSIIDLFAGVGGMSLGMEAAGFDIDISVELNPVHAAVHHFNFPYTSTICGDLTKISTIELASILEERNRNELDVLVGGAPCQGFSQIGKRQLDDPRNQLVFEYFRVVRDLRPKYFVFENVPGIIAGKHKQFISELIEEFDKIGYSITLPYKVLNAANFNVAQSRKRFILLGTRKGQTKLSYPLALCNKSEKENTFSLFPNNDCRVPTAHDAINDLEPFHAFVGEDEGIPFSEINYGEYSKKLSFLKSAEFALCHNRNLNSNYLWGHLGSKHTEISIKRFAATIPGKTEKGSRFFRLSPELPCNTLRAGTPSGKGAFTAARPIHYSYPRCITIREAARLHSYPDWFNFHRTIWHGFRQIGNSVAPLFAKSIGEATIRNLKVNLDNLEIYELEKQEEKLTKMNMTEATKYFGYDRNYMPTRKRSQSKKIAAIYE
ncbi:MAG TPA: DNA cytosine methyltransferase [Bacteroidetes bacterium]|nr:DNA cytosine methyltransferase [Bacteroidota bacterium]